jgi:hypothetical protein
MPVHSIPRPTSRSVSVSPSPDLSATSIARPKSQASRDCSTDRNNPLDEPGAFGGSQRRCGSDGGGRQCVGIRSSIFRTGSSDSAGAGSAGSPHHSSHEETLCAFARTPISVHHAEAQRRRGAARGERRFIRFAVRANEQSPPPTFARFARRRFHAGLG